MFEKPFWEGVLTAINYDYSLNLSYDKISLMADDITSLPENNNRKLDHEGVEFWRNAATELFGKHCLDDNVNALPSIADNLLSEEMAMNGKLKDIDDALDTSDSVIVFMKSMCLYEKTKAMYEANEKAISLGCGILYGKGDFEAIKAELNQLKNR